MKELKTEYEKTLDENVPDLWNRIDKALDDIDNKKPSENKDNVIPFYKKKTYKTIVKAVSFAACACILFFGIKLFVISPQKPKSAAMYDCAPAEVSAKPPAAATSEAEPAVPEALMEESAVSESSENRYMIVPNEVPPHTEEILYSFEETEDGTFKCNDKLYSLKLVYESEDGSTAYIVLSNVEGLTYEEVYNSLSLSNNDGSDFVVVTILNY